MFQDSLAIDKFLGHEASSGKHGKATVLEFLGLELKESIGVFGLEAEGVKAEVTRDISLTQETRLVKGHILGFDPSNLGALLFGDTNGDEQGHPEADGDLGEVGDGGSLDGGVEEERRTFDLLTDKEANHGEHRNTSVSEFGFAVTLQGGLIGLFGKAKGVEKTDWGEGTGDGIDGEGRELGGRGLLGSEGGEGGGRGGKESDGGGEGLHVGVDGWYLAGCENYDENDA